MIIRSMFLCALALLAVGCASVINGTTQEVGLRSLPPGATVSVSGRSATTPAKLKLARNQDHTATFTLGGFPEQQAHLKQKLDGAFYGNLLLGGIIGMAVDMGKGAAYRLSPSNVEMDMGTGTAREFDDAEPVLVAVAPPPPPPPPPPPLMPPMPAAAGSPPPTGTAGLGAGVPLIVKGIVYHPDTGKPVDCQVLLAWTLEERSDGIKSAAFNREVGGDGAVLTGLTALQLTTGMAMRDACQQAGASR